jgi:hypothetical protein
MTGESGGLLDPGAYGGDPLSALGDELREAPLSADGSEGSGLVITQVGTQEITQQCQLLGNISNGVC